MKYSFVDKRLGNRFYTKQEQKIIKSVMIAKWILILTIGDLLTVLLGFFISVYIFPQKNVGNMILSALSISVAIIIFCILGAITVVIYFMAAKWSDQKSGLILAVIFLFLIYNFAKQNFIKSFQWGVPQGSISESMQLSYIAIAIHTIGFAAAVSSFRYIKSQTAQIEDADQKAIQRQERLEIETELIKEQNRLQEEAFIRFCREYFAEKSGGKTSSSETDQPQHQSSSDQTTNKKEAAKDPSDFDFFVGCKTIEDITARYRALSKLYHPDVPGGDVSTSQIINAEYEQLKKKFMGQSQSK